MKKSYYISFQSLFIILSIFSLIKNAEEIEGRIRIDGKGDWIIETQDFKEEYLYIATAFYTPNLEENGWDFLSIKTNNMFSDELQAEGAGRLEGSLTKDRIFNHYQNVLSLDGHLMEETAEFFRKQEEFLLSKKEEYNKDSVLYNAYLLYLQFKGIRDQYNLEVTEDKKIDDIEFNLLNAFGDLDDINSKFSTPSFEKMDEEELYNYFLTNTHCSAIFKVKDDLSDIFFAHNSWFYMIMMTRIFKEYNLNFNDKSVKSHNVMFSSYPGTVVSNDDFYHTSKGLVVIETTNVNYNKTSFELITPESLLCWQRVQIANRMSENAVEWTNNFIQYNSGTYNNQYMVLSINDIELGKYPKLKENSFMIVEQMPQYAEIHDVTDDLKFGYWPSYNVPFSDYINEIANNTEMKKSVKNMNNYMDYNTCSRANIMRRDHHNISDIETMKKFMQYNNYQNDPYTKGQPTESIAARGDLRQKSICFGAFDTKISSVQELKGKDTKTIYLYSGATSDNVPQFSFKSPCCEKYSHIGIPDEPKNPWITFNNKFNFNE